MPGGPRDGACCRRPALFNPRHDLVPQVVAVVAQLPVAGVVNKLERMTSRVGAKVIARNLQQRSQQEARPERGPGRHSAQSGWPRATQQLQQKGFRLVIQVMCEQQRLTLL